MERIAGLASADCFNPYRDTCDRFDLADAPQIRRRNLQRMLAAALRDGVDALWVARDLSYNGGRRTGLPMTDEVRLDSYGGLLGVEGLRRATRGPPVVEQTSRVVWTAIGENGSRVWLWNVFPLHPHEKDLPFTNRAHKAAERKAGLILLDWLLANIRWRSVVAIGRDAESAVSSLGVEAAGVRHPSHGGQAAFLRGIEGLRSNA